jgi:hypothetical protein
MTRQFNPCTCTLNFVSNWEIIHNGFKSLHFHVAVSLSLGSRHRIGDSYSTKLYERRVVVRGGSIKTITLSGLSNTKILRVWIPNSIIFLNWNRPTEWFGIRKGHELLQSIVFESNSHLIRIESEAFSPSSLQSILIPRNVEILGSKCFSSCNRLSSITFESNSHLTRIESEAFHQSSLESILIPSNVEILGSKCFSSCNRLSSSKFESHSRLTRIESEAYYGLSLESI